MINWPAAFITKLQKVMVSMGLYQSFAEWERVYAVQRRALSIVDSVTASELKHPSGNRFSKQQPVTVRSEYGCLNRLQLFILECVLRRHYIRGSDLVRLTGLENHEIGRILQDLVSRGLLEKEGRCYFISPEGPSTEEAENMSTEGQLYWRWLAFRPELRLHLACELRRRRVKLNNSLVYLTVLAGMDYRAITAAFEGKRLAVEDQGDAEWMGKLAQEQRHLLQYLTLREWHSLTVIASQESGSTTEVANSQKVPLWRAYNHCRNLEALQIIREKTYNQEARGLLTSDTPQLSIFWVPAESVRQGFYSSEEQFWQTALNALRDVRRYTRPTNVSPSLEQFKQLAQEDSYLSWVDAKQDALLCWLSLNPDKYLTMILYHHQLGKGSVAKSAILLREDLIKTWHWTNYVSLTSTGRQIVGAVTVYKEHLRKQNVIWQKLLREQQLRLLTFMGNNGGRITNKDSREQFGMSGIYHPMEPLLKAELVELRFAGMNSYWILTVKGKECLKDMSLLNMRVDGALRNVTRSF